MAKTQATGVSISGNALYKWTVSPADADEFYLELIGGGDPSIAEPTDIFAESALLTAGAVGSLTVGTWDYGDNDTLGFSVIYVRLASDLDPQDSGYGVIVASSTSATPYGDPVFRATATSGALSETVTVERDVIIRGIKLHLGAEGATTENLVVQINSDNGSTHDTLLISQDMNGVTDFFSNTEIKLAAGDDLLITYTNTDDSSWGLTVVWDAA